jgi:Tol biopolymer transport system component
MNRMILAGAAMLFTVGCGSAGPEASWASEVFPDTVDVRRVDIPDMPLPPGPNLGVAPDGRTLVGFDFPLGALTLVGMDGQVRRLETGPGYSPGDAPRFSRDGRWIAYDWYSPESDLDLELRVLPLDGSSPSVVLHRAGYIVPMDWSPDGKAIAAIEFSEDNTVRVILIPKDGGEPLLVRALDWRAPNAVSFSPDGRFLAYDVPTGTESLERDVAVYDLEGGRERSILDDPANDLLLGWSPTGDIYFRSERAGLPAAWRVPMSNGRPSGEPELVKPDFLRTKPVGFTQAGDFFYAVRAGGTVAYAVTLDARGAPSGPARALTPPSDLADNPNLAVSPDGRLLSYVASESLGARRDNDKGGTLLKAVAIDGTPTREFHLPPRMRGAALHRWLPDGSGLIFRGNEEGRYGIFRLDFASGDVELLQSGGGLERAAGRFRFDLTPDGESLVYIEDADGVDGSRVSRLVVYDLVRGTGRTLVSGPDSGPNVPPAVSPDGGQVAFYALDGSPGVSGNAAFLWDGSYELMVVSLSGGEPRRIATTTGGPLAWTADGAAILVGGPDIVRIPLTRGAPESLGIGGRVLGVDRRGTTLFFSSYAPEERYELWLMKLGAVR